MPRIESEQLHRAAAEKLTELTARVNARDDRGHGLHNGWVILVSAIGVLTGIAALAFALMK